jgi:hypothetical protein
MREMMSIKMMSMSESIQIFVRYVIWKGMNFQEKLTLKESRLLMKIYHYSMTNFEIG